MFLSARALAEDGGDFRGYKWGTPIDEVTANESVRALKERPSMLVMDDMIGHINVTAAFIFQDDRLAMGSYFDKENYLNTGSYVADYFYLRDLLEKKYGKPDQVSELWRTDSEAIRSNHHRWGDAVASGHLALLSVWQNDRTRIMLTCQGEKYQITVSVTYQSVEARPRFDEQRIQDSSKNL